MVYLAFQSRKKDLLAVLLILPVDRLFSFPIPAVIVSNSGT